MNAIKPPTGPTPREDTWGLWGFVLGGALPSDRLVIGDAEIVRLSAAELGHVLAKSRVRPYMSGIRIGYQVLPSAVHVYSEWVVRWTVRSRSSEVAEEEVLRGQLPRLLAALNSLPGAPYRIQMMRVGRVDIERQRISEERSFWFGGTVGFGPDVKSLHCNDSRLLEAAWKALNERPDVWEHARHYQDAIILADLRAGSPAAMAAAPLTSIHRFSEGVVDHVLKSEPRRVREQPFRDRIRAAVRRLDASDLEEELIAFYSFRNEYFAHSGLHMDDAIAHEWTGRATTACRQLLHAWISKLSGTSTDYIPIDDPSREVLADGSQSYPVTAKWPRLD